VLGENIFIPKEFKTISNLDHISIEEFKEIQDIS
jgi:hypothetical protein